MATPKLFDKYFLSKYLKNAKDKFSYHFSYFHLFILNRTGKSNSVHDNQKGVGPIVSLTTIESRLDKVYIAIESLLHQTMKPKKIVLWINEEIKNKKLPRTITRQLSRGLEVKYVRDVGPHTKLIYALKEYNEVIVTADDDILYPANWLLQLDRSYKAVPDAIHCHRAHEITFSPTGKIRPYEDWLFEKVRYNHSLTVFPTGVGGVLYPPGSLHKDAIREDLFEELCPKADDVWFKIMSLLLKTKCIAINLNYKYRKFPTVSDTQKENLFTYNHIDGQNNVQFQQCLKFYGLGENSFLSDELD